MDWLRSEDLKEEKNVTTPIVIIAVHALCRFEEAAGRRAGRTVTLVAIRSGLWETVRMEPTARKLVFHKSRQFTGWTCTVCGWAQPIPRLVQSGGDLPENIETDFANHECAKYPRKPRATPSTS
jgi:hypothetical protein